MAAVAAGYIYWRVFYVEYLVLGSVRCFHCGVLLPDN